MLVDEGNRTWNAKTTATNTTCEIPTDDAVAMIYNISLSSNQYQKLTTLCLLHNVAFLTRNQIDNIKSYSNPSITSSQCKSFVTNN